MNGKDEVENERAFDETIELKGNAMLKVRPELFTEWDFDKNEGLDIYKTVYGSIKVAWWNCPICRSPYDMPIGYRAGKQKSNCPYCRGYRVNHTNSLASLNPELAKEWHPVLNGSLTPHEVACSKNKEVWWLGECTHKWKATINSRTKEKGTGCPYCAPNPKILKGFNDMWTTNPILASMLANSEDGYRYTQGSGERVDWKCLDCGESVKNKKINNVRQKNLSCPKCSDGVSFPEKFMYNLLIENEINFDYNTLQEWSQGKKYDFYLPEYSTIIETHGGQHYGRGFLNMGERARTFDEEKENDILKENLAKENGIDNYIIIDVRESSIDFISSNILNSDIMKIVKDIDFAKIGQLSSKNFIKQACQIWLEETKSIPMIAEKLKIASSTVTRYLKRGAEIGWCNYCPKEAKLQSNNKKGLTTKKVVQLNKKLTFIKCWDSIVEASEFTEINRAGISNACRGASKTAGGFKWMFKEDYDQAQKDGLQIKDIG